jgi:hypothetical protein
MKVFFTTLLVTISVVGFSQDRRPLETKPIPRNYNDSLFKIKLKEKLAEIDTANGKLRLPQTLRAAPNGLQAPEPKMPTLKLETTGKYLGNNGKGADIYAMSPDNMPCLVPDSTFQSRMPVSRLNSTLKLLDKKEK